RPHIVSTGSSGEDLVGPGLATAPALLVLRGPLARARAAGPGHRPHPRRRLAHGARRPVEPAVLRRAAREELRGIRRPAGSVRQGGGAVHRHRRLRALLHPDAADSLAALAHRTVFPRLARGPRLLLAPTGALACGEPRTAHPGRHRYRHQPDPGSTDRCPQLPGGVAPVSWTPQSWGGKERPRCRRAIDRTRQSFGRGSLSWCGRDERQRSWAGSSSPPPRRSGTG